MIIFIAISLLQFFIGEMAQQRTKSLINFDLQSDGLLFHPATANFLYLPGMKYSTPQYFQQLSDTFFTFTNIFITTSHSKITQK